MSNQKIKFGNFDITIDPKLNFSNAVLYPRKNMAAEFEGLSSYLDKQLSKKHKKQNLKGIKGAGKRYWQVNEREIKKLEKIAIQYNASDFRYDSLTSATTLPEEILNPEKYQEGATKQISVNIYERNTKARKKCIEHYGDSCTICGFNFGIVFGVIGSGFIHVHHLTPLAEIGKTYILDPVEDLRPVCPNCHAMIHRESPALSIDALIKIRKANN